MPSPSPGPLPQAHLVALRHREDEAAEVAGAPVDEVEAILRLQLGQHEWLPAGDKGALSGHLGSWLDLCKATRNHKTCPEGNTPHWDKITKPTGPDTYTHVAHMVLWTQRLSPQIHMLKS